MIFNLMSLIGLLLSLAIIYLMRKFNQGEKLVFYLSMFLLLYKAFEYGYLNVTGHLAYPMEISTVTYFMFSIIYLFKIKKFYHVAAFFGIISGIGFFSYYTTLGFMSTLYFGIYKHIMATIFHGILLIGGAYLMMTHQFTRQNKYAIYLVMLLILTHALSFYTDGIKGTTFIYFIIHPDFLMISNNVWINYIVKLAYNMSISMGFIYLVKLYYRLTDGLHGVFRYPFESSRKRASKVFNISKELG